MTHLRPLRHGDFTGLAADYAKYRPGYSDSVLTALLALVGKPAAAIEAADIGAGTGIWTRMLAARGLRRVTAVEPNDDMRREGEAGSPGVTWRAGSGEATGLPTASADLLSMASSFHWVDFAAGLAEFHRVLRPGGRFVALWNPRFLDDSPLLLEIEAELARLRPDIRRVSSGRSGITETLTDRLRRHPRFEDVVYLEGRHSLEMPVAHYIGAWRSVNDLQVQLGPERFEAFLRFVADRLAGQATVRADYLTRAWCARRRDG
ncbi:class I SAM-dependent methyltransferase [Paracraurococcus ruber]|uniref:Methyltransferase n=1 Tax=Paracraurococcus ruber TaxID=77675 RepID=A0ABS1CVQ6_9PROT|nr:class I SAM-dependent methyltransferase [Paracraurococcus ruber]MBK1658601.1 methyltransferase [Paracraurococcus ruber]TDG28505.1 class I SAM-dependent methyltransferase [Paracraurococcus ruber]